MPEVLVRGLDADTLVRLKARAERNGRSLQAELQSILVQAAETESREGARLAAEIRKRLEGRHHTDSARILAQDRRR